MEADKAPLPDHLRCNRTDGRKWRCSRRAMDNKRMCEIHHLQLQHRQHREKVPESLKLQPNRKRTVARDLGITTRRSANKVKHAKGGESLGVSEALDSALKRMKLKKGDLQLELIRTFLKRRSEMITSVELQEDSEGELTRDLPNGLMAISSTPLPKHYGNAISCGIKVGRDTPPSAFTRRHFRSKNIEPMQLIPCWKNVANLRKNRRKKCHWCHKSFQRNLIKCLSCKKEVFCVGCIKRQYFGTVDEVTQACPVCRKACGCRTCLLSQAKDLE